MPHAKGTLYLIPAFLSPDSAYVLPDYITETVRSIHHFFVENERSARRFLKALDKAITIDDRDFSVVNTQHPPDLNLLNRWLNKGNNAGIISEAGYPCIADPGNLLVKEAHRLQAKVIPLVGPNAMLLALAASGFNGQQFCFSGYLPVRQHERIKTLKELEKKALKTGETQIFMETPYRNNALVKDILQHCAPHTMLCIAADITAPGEFIRSRTVKEWRQSVPDLNKRPAVFLLSR